MGWDGMGWMKRVACCVSGQLIYSFKACMREVSQFFLDVCFSICNSISKLFEEINSSSLPPCPFDPSH